ncbi:hypothetical protein DIPPA_19033 [Diplonema papillatum]|nr:hypothetical protein DIPPA_19033 [Diplonema papillatum]
MPSNTESAEPATPALGPSVKSQLLAFCSWMFPKKLKEFESVLAENTDDQLRQVLEMLREQHPNWDWAIASDEDYCALDQTLSRAQSFSGTVSSPASGAKGRVMDLFSTQKAPFSPSSSMNASTARASPMSYPSKSRPPSFRTQSVRSRLKQGGEGKPDDKPTSFRRRLASVFKRTASEESGRSAESRADRRETRGEKAGFERLRGGWVRRKGEEDPSADAAPAENVVGSPLCLPAADSGGASAGACVVGPGVTPRKDSRASPGLPHAIQSAFPAVRRQTATALGAPPAALTGKGREGGAGGGFASPVPSLNPTVSSATPTEAVLSPPVPKSASTNATVPVQRGAAAALPFLDESSGVVPDLSPLAWTSMEPKLPGYHVDRVADSASLLSQTDASAPAHVLFFADDKDSQAGGCDVARLESEQTQFRSPGFSDWAGHSTCPQGADASHPSVATLALDDDDDEQPPPPAAAGGLAASDFDNDLLPFAAAFSAELQTPRGRHSTGGGSSTACDPPALRGRGARLPGPARGSEHSGGSTPRGRQTTRGSGGAGDHSSAGTPGTGKDGSLDRRGGSASKGRQITRGSGGAWDHSSVGTPGTGKDGSLDRRRGSASKGRPTNLGSGGAGDHSSVGTPGTGKDGSPDHRGSGAGPIFRTLTGGIEGSGTPSARPAGRSSSVPGRKQARGLSRPGSSASQEAFVLSGEPSATPQEGSLSRASSTTSGRKQARGSRAGLSASQKALVPGEHRATPRESGLSRAGSTTSGRKRARGSRPGSAASQEALVPGGLQKSSPSRGSGTPIAQPAGRSSSAPGQKQARGSRPGSPASQEAPVSGEHSATPEPESSPREASGTLSARPAGRNPSTPGSRQGPSASQEAPVPEPQESSPTPTSGTASPSPGGTGRRSTVPQRPSPTHTVDDIIEWVHVQYGRRGSTGVDDPSEDELRRGKNPKAPRLSNAAGWRKPEQADARRDPGHRKGGKSSGESRLSSTTGRRNRRADSSEGNTAGRRRPGTQRSHRSGHKTGRIPLGSESESSKTSSDRHSQSSEPEPRESGGRAASRKRPGTQRSHRSGRKTGWIPLGGESESSKTSNDLHTESSEPEPRQSGGKAANRKRRGTHRSRRSGHETGRFLPGGGSESSIAGDSACSESSESEPRRSGGRAATGEREGNRIPPGADDSKVASGAGSRPGGNRNSTKEDGEYWRLWHQTNESRARLRREGGLDGVGEQPPGELSELTLWQKLTGAQTAGPGGVLEADRLAALRGEAESGTTLSGTASHRKPDELPSGGSGGWSAESSSLREASSRKTAESRRTPRGTGGAARQGKPDASTESEPTRREGRRGRPGGSATTGAPRRGRRTHSQGSGRQSSRRPPGAGPQARSRREKPTRSGRGSGDSHSGFDASSCGRAAAARDARGREAPEETSRGRRRKQPSFRRSSSAASCGRGAVARGGRGREAPEETSRGRRRKQPSFRRSPSAAEHRHAAAEPFGRHPDGGGSESYETADELILVDAPPAAASRWRTVSELPIFASGSPARGMPPDFTEIPPGFRVPPVAKRVELAVVRSHSEPADDIEKQGDAPATGGAIGLWGAAPRASCVNGGYKGVESDGGGAGGGVSGRMDGEGAPFVPRKRGGTLPPRGGRRASSGNDRKRSRHTLGRAVDGIRHPWARDPLDGPTHNSTAQPSPLAVPLDREQPPFASSDSDSGTHRSPSNRRPPSASPKHRSASGPQTGGDARAVDPGGSLVGVLDALYFHDPRSDGYTIPKPPINTPNAPAAPKTFTHADRATTVPHTRAHDPPLPRRIQRSASPAQRGKPGTHPPHVYPTVPASAARPAAAVPSYLEASAQRQPSAAQSSSSHRTEHLPRDRHPGSAPAYEGKEGQALASSRSFDVVAMPSSAESRKRPTALGSSQHVQRSSPIAEGMDAIWRTSSGPPVLSGRRGSDGGAKGKGFARRMSREKAGCEGEEVLDVGSQRSSGDTVTLMQEVDSLRKELEREQAKTVGLMRAHSFSASRGRPSANKTEDTQTDGLFNTDAAQSHNQHPRFSDLSGDPPRNPASDPRKWSSNAPDDPLPSPVSHQHNPQSHPSARPRVPGAAPRGPVRPLPSSVHTSASPSPAHGRPGQKRASYPFDGPPREAVRHRNRHSVPAFSEPYGGAAGGRQPFSDRHSVPAFSKPFGGAPGGRQPLSDRHSVPAFSEPYGDALGGRQPLSDRHSVPAFSEPYGGAAGGRQPLSDRHSVPAFSEPYGGAPGGRQPAGAPSSRASYPFNDPPPDASSFAGHPGGSSPQRRAPSPFGQTRSESAAASLPGHSGGVHAAASQRRASSPFGRSRSGSAAADLSRHSFREQRRSTEQSGGYPASMPSESQQTGQTGLGSSAFANDLQRLSFGGSGVGPSADGTGLPSHPSRGGNQRGAVPGGSGGDEGGRPALLKPPSLAAAPGTGGPRQGSNSPVSVEDSLRLAELARAELVKGGVALAPPGSARQARAGGAFSSPGAAVGQLRGLTLPPPVPPMPNHERGATWAHRPPRRFPITSPAESTPHPVAQRGAAPGQGGGQPPPPPPRFFDGPGLAETQGAPRQEPGGSSGEPRAASGSPGELSRQMSPFPAGKRAKRRTEIAGSIGAGTPKKFAGGGGERPPQAFPLAAAPSPQVKNTPAAAAAAADADLFRRRHVESISRDSPSGSAAAGSVQPAARASAAKHGRLIPRTPSFSDLKGGSSRLFNASLDVMPPPFLSDPFISSRFASPMRRSVEL